MSVYEPTTWVNETAPSISAQNLGHLETGVEDSHEEIEEIALGNTSVDLASTTNKARFIPAATEDKIGGIKVYNIVDAVSGEVTSVITAPSFTDLPGAVISFNASDNLPGVIKIEFTPATDALYHDLYRDELLIATNINPGFLYRTDAGTWDFYIVANNMFGATSGIHDSGTARAIPTAPPVEITDFVASDEEVLKVIFWWTDHEDAYKFDLYKEGVLEVANIRPGYQLIQPEGVAEYHVVAINFLDSTESNPDSGTSLSLAPSTVQNFIASDNLVASIQTTFDYIHQPCTYDLYRDNVLYRNNVYSTYLFAALDDTWDFFIRASNTLGHTDSDINPGTSLPANYPPGLVADFTASDDLRREIRIDFTPTIDAGRYDLYRNDVIFLQDVYPGMRFDADVDTWTFRIEAINGKGSTLSNPDDGTAVRAITAPPTEIIDFVISDTLVNSLQITFTRAEEAVRHDLFRAGLTYKTDVKSGDVIPSFSGTWDFHVRAVNPLGAQNSNTDEGISLPANSAPAPITDFAASDDLDNKVQISFAMTNTAARYDLYRSNEKLAEDIVSGYEYLTSAGTWEFHVKSLNIKGTTDSNEDSGTAVATDLPPSKIEDFDATDGLTDEIVMTFSNADGAIDYDLYRNDALLEVNVHNGYILTPTGTGTWTFNVVANNDIDSTDSNVNDGSSVAPVAKPSYDASLIASDNEIEEVIITWNGVGDADYYDLYVNDSLLQSHATSGYVHAVTSGSRVYNHRAVNAGGWTESNDNIGTPVSESNPPGPISSFIASESSSSNITFSFSLATDATSYIIRNVDTNEIVVYDAYPGSSYVPSNYITNWYIAEATNAEGTSYSSPDEGTMIRPAPLPGDVTINYGSTGGSNPETVTGSGYSWLWTAPDYVTSVSICMCGAGGGGASTNDTRNAGGGRAGQVLTTSITVIPNNTYSITIGPGGTSVNGGENEGQTGGTTYFSTLSAIGGEGGDYGDNIGYKGEGESVFNCSGTHYDGNSETEPTLGAISYGGQGCFGNGGNGAYYTSAVDGEAGAGGGGVAHSVGSGEPSGAGGAGQVRLSWG